MAKVTAGITMSLDGYTTGPNDGPGCGLGEGGERLHYWVFGGPWSYDEEPRGEATGADKEYLEESFGRSGAVIGGRNTYEACLLLANRTSRSSRARDPSSAPSLPNLGCPGRVLDSPVNDRTVGLQRGQIEQRVFPQVRHGRDRQDPSVLDLPALAQDAGTWGGLHVGDPPQALANA